MIEFRGSPPTIGMELELQLLDADTLDLIDGIMPLMKFFPDTPYVKPEWIANTVEIASRPCETLDQLEAHMRELLDEIADRAARLGMVLAGAGSHPFGQRLATVTRLPRYLEMEARMGYLGHIQIAFATHVHIGMPSGDEAIGVMRELKPYLPLLLAVAASSPFWRGHDTGCASYRHRILAASRSYGIPPSFADWAQFCHFAQTTRRAGIFPTVHDIHWDLRPSPHYGTVEVRVMDAQPSITDAMAIAALVRALIQYLQSHGPDERAPGMPAPLPWWLEKHNHYEASRLGLDATVVTTETGDCGRLSRSFDRVMTAIDPGSASADISSRLGWLRARTETGLSYQRQRLIYAQTGSTRRVTAALVDELKETHGAR